MASDPNLFVFVLVVLIVLILSIWPIVALIRHINVMPTWAIMVSIISLLFFPGIGGLITLILAYTARDPAKVYFENYRYALF